MTKARDLANASTALSAVSATELGYLDGVTSAVQTQIDAKLASSTAATTYVANSLADAKGDLLVASADNTVTRLPVGSTGDTIVADSSTSTGLRYQGSQAAGKNAIINGGFDIWQRATSSTTTSGYVAADRWTVFSGGAVTWARESTTVPAGSTYSMKITAGASIQPIIYQAIETLNAIQFAGKNVSLSLLAQASTNTNITFDIQWSSAVDNPAGGSWTTITATSGGSGTATTSGFTQLSGVFAIPSTAKSLFVRVYTSGNIASGVIVYYGQIQLELGSVATQFSRAGGTIQGELAACQRYYWRAGGSNNYEAFSTGFASATGTAFFQLANPVVMRTNPISLDYSTLAIDDGVSTIAISSMTIQASTSGPKICTVNATVSGATQFRTYRLLANNSSAAYLGLSAEL